MALRSMLSSTRGRHLAAVLLGAALVYAFGMVHGTWSPMHRWNRATADASVVLLALTMAVGPAARLWQGLRRLLPFRRELGIYSVALAAVHTAIILDGWVEWDFARLFGLAYHPILERFVMVQHGFGLANAIGILALLYGLFLKLTSNDRSVRLLSAPTWKYVQRGAYVLWALTVIHTAYFLFMNFLDYHRNTPAPNPLQWWFVGLVLTVQALRLAASLQTWRQRGIQGGRNEVAA